MARQISIQYSTFGYDALSAVLGAVAMQLTRNIELLNPELSDILVYITTRR